MTAAAKWRTSALSLSSHPCYLNVTNFILFFLFHLEAEHICCSMLVHLIGIFYPNSIYSLSMSNHFYACFQIQDKGLEELEYLELVAFKWLARLFFLVDPRQ